MLVVKRNTTIKHTFIALGTMLFSVLCVVMIITTCFLISEYQFFREQSKRLLILQDEYQTYIQAYKEACDISKKKKSINNDLVYLAEDEQEAEHQFNLVNRDSLYLRDSALTFGKANNLEAILKDVYENYDTQKDEQKISSAKTGRRQSRSNTTLIKKKNIPPYALTQFSNFNLRWPINTAQFWLSSKFGPRKKKNDKAWGFHHGIDLAALKGTAVYAAAKGLIVEASYSKGYGNSIVIEHNPRFKTRYAHLDKVFIAKGQRVHEGQVIGSVGDTGYVHGKNASHLHFEVIEFGKRINPLRNLATR